MSHSADSPCTDTLITSFPRRWGKNRPDPSAVHKSLRLRLQYLRPGEVTSAYDLALIVIDECSRVFFDRTKPNDRQPNVVELFAAAIRGVTYKQTAAFDQFLVYTHLATTEYTQHRQANMSTQKTLLNINPEGNLLKEIKDVMDEIHILLRVQEQQQIALESFVKNVRLALLPRVRRSGAAPPALASSSAWDALLGGVPAATAAGAAPGEDGGLAGAEVARLRDDAARQQTRRTLTKADHLLQDLQERKRELHTLLENARTTSSAVSIHPPASLATSIRQD